MDVSLIKTTNYNEKWTMDTWLKQTQTKPKDYENETLSEYGKNKANSNPIKPDFKAKKQVKNPEFPLRFLGIKLTRDCAGRAGLISGIRFQLQGYHLLSARLIFRECIRPAQL